MLRVVSDYAQQNGFVLVMEYGPSAPVYYAAKEIDITDEVVKRYDAANPVAAAASTPAASALVDGERTNDGGGASLG